MQNQKKTQYNAKKSSSVVYCCFAYFEACGNGKSYKFNYLLLGTRSVVFSALTLDFLRV